MKANYPLPLELTRPIEIAPLEIGLRKGFGAEDSRYNPATQVRETPAGVPRILDCGGGGTSSSQESESQFNLVVIDVQLDVQIDDNDF